MNKPTKMIASALVGGSVLLTAACGSSDRPSVSDIQNALQKHESSIPASATKCIATVIHDSKISDGTLKKMVSGDVKFQDESAFPKDDQTAAKAALGQIMKCIMPSGMPSMPTNMPSMP